MCPVAYRKDSCCPEQAGVTEDRCCHACKSCRQAGSSTVYQVWTDYAISPFIYPLTYIFFPAENVSIIYLVWNNVYTAIFQIFCEESLNVHDLLLQVKNNFSYVFNHYLFLSFIDIPRPNREWLSTQEPNKGSSAWWKCRKIQWNLHDSSQQNWFRLYFSAHICRILKDKTVFQDQ